MINFTRGIVRSVAAAAFALGIAAGSHASSVTFDLSGSFLPEENELTGPFAGLTDYTLTGEYDPNEIVFDTYVFDEFATGFFNFSFGGLSLDHTDDIDYIAGFGGAALFFDNGEIVGLNFVADEGADPNFPFISVATFDYIDIAQRTDFGYNFAFAPLSAQQTPGTGAVPEPATWLMMLAGFALAGLGLQRRHKNNVVFA